MASSLGRARVLATKGSTTIYDSYPLSLRTLFMANDDGPPPPYGHSRSHLLEALTQTVVPNDDFLSTLHDTSSSMDSSVLDLHDGMVQFFSSSSSIYRCLYCFVLWSPIRVYGVMYTYTYTRADACAGSAKTNNRQRCVRLIGWYANFCVCLIGLIGLFVCLFASAAIDRVALWAIKPSDWQVA